VVTLSARVCYGPARKANNSFDRVEIHLYNPLPLISKCRRKVSGQIYALLTSSFTVKFASSSEYLNVMPKSLTPVAKEIASVFALQLLFRDFQNGNYAVKTPGLGRMDIRRSMWD
jgi:hypothetical protein